MQKSAIPAIFFADTKAQAAFSEAGPQPQFLLDSEQFKVVLAGLEAGQHIPPHPESAAVYHILEGSGVMHVGDNAFDIAPGATVIAPAGAERGVQAATRLVFLAAKCG